MNENNPLLLWRCSSQPSHHISLIMSGSVLVLLDNRNKLSRHENCLKHWLHAFGIKEGKLRNQRRNSFISLYCHNPNDNTMQHNLNTAVGLGTNITVQTTPPTPPPHHLTNLTAASVSLRTTSIDQHQQAGPQQQQQQKQQQHQQQNYQL